ncbi:membrane protein [Pseudothermotoga hypogea DSM 11164 = NBRC 106472]|uniref:Membrane protein n=1 Tax=Pseudothermotoga hypogea DSM 11164 = NBRC 106472 TaxID=1123384 RepID=A0A0X1KSQ8_9THEM|nr:membrane protein [Pseudothermotoga hypogea DSM 11164 = NBRC 106472]
MYLARKDERVPRRSKILIALALGYALSPIDLVPDFIPLLSQLDDLLIIPALIALALKSIPKEALDEYREKAQQLRMKRRFGMVSLFILAFWAVLAIWLMKLLSKLF